MASLPTFSANDVRTFLAAVDRYLNQDTTIKILGGSAMLLAYEVTVTTSDIDTFESNLLQLENARKLATQETGLDIPISPAGGNVGDWPENSEDRLVPVMPELKHLKVFALEAHDLALSKAVRGWEKDLSMIDALHANHSLDLETLYHRYTEEMSPIGNEASIDMSFLAMIDRLFGTGTAIETKDRLEERRKKRLW
jgi:hypothetical protein